MTFVVGDIHGEISKLKSLISCILKQDEYPELIFVGDYLDKGEDVSKTLYYLDKISEEFKCTFLIGNHEYLWMNLRIDDHKSIEYLKKYGGQRTIESFNSDGIFDAKNKLLKGFQSFFNKLEPYCKRGDYIIVHSGIPSNLLSTPLEEIPIEKLLFNRYNFIKEESLYLGKYKIIFGHTGFYYPFTDNFKIGIDTAACFIKEQPLTAFCLETRDFIHSDGEIFSIENISKIYRPNIPRTKPWRMI